MRIQYRTRIILGKNLVVAIGAKKALAFVVNNAKTQQRNTFLDGRLRD